jgi:hypothetical protein
MALSSISQALAQFNANAGWYTTQGSAALRLEAVEYLLTNRAQKMGDQGSELNYESLESQAQVLRQFVGAGAPRAFGRSRYAPARFGGAGIP